MRTDVKLGIAISMALVLVVGGYFLFKTEPAAPISIAETATPASTAAKPSMPADVKPGPANRGMRADGPIRPGNQPNQRNAQPRVSPGAGDSSRTAQGPTHTPTNPARPTDTAVQPNSLPFTLPQNAERSATNPPAANPGGDTAAPPADTRTVDTSGAAQPVRSDLPVRVDSPATLAANDPANGTNANPPSGSASPALEQSKPGPTLRDSAMEVHRSQPGDTLISLAQAYYGSAAYVPLLREYNPQINDPSRLAPGTAVKIPAVPPGWQAKASSVEPSFPGGTRQPPAGGQATPAGKTTRAMTANSGAGKSGRTYTVRAGDSFYRIAEQQLGNPNRWKELLTMNTSVVKGDPTRLRPGHVLVLPES